MYTIRKLVEFECAHQLTGAVSELCNATIHGHSYKCEIFLEAKDLRNQMVLDFGELKQIKEQIMEKFDHALFLPANLLNSEEALVFCKLNKRLTFISCDPSAEWMAHEIFQVVGKALNTLSNAFYHDEDSTEIRQRVYVAKVRIHETRTGWAEYTEER